jgi:hypothetical protein
MILLFTRARDDRPLYRRDLLNVCCEATGTHIRFGYDKEYFARSLWPKIQSKAIEGTKALVIYCEVNDAFGNYFTFHPIREAKIVEVTPERDSATLEIELGNFFDYENFRDQSPSIIERFQEYVLQNAEQPAAVEKSNRRYVREEVDWDRAQYSNKEWLPLIKHLKVLQGLRDCYFFSVQYPTSFGGAPAFLFPNHKLEEGRITYELKSGESFQISLYVIQGAEATYKTPKLTIEEAISSVTVSGPFIRQRSRESQADFIVHCRKSYDDERGLLILTIPSDNPDQIKAPSIQSMINFSVSRRRVVATIILLTLGPFLISLGPDFIRETALHLGANPGNEFVQHPYLISVILKLLGTASFAVGAFWGVRKLPIKF